MSIVVSDFSLSEKVIRFIYLLNKQATKCQAQSQLLESHNPMTATET